MLTSTSEDTKDRRGRLRFAHDTRGVDQDDAEKASWEEQEKEYIEG